jgi:DNA-binding CsgD family transcriptional regulator
VLDTAETFLVPSVTPAEVAALQPDLAPITESLGVRGFIVAPLATRGRCSGFLWQVRLRPEPRLDEDERRFLQEVAVRLAMFVESWRQGEALELAVPAGGGLAGVLTAREREILELVGRGETDRSVAHRLGLSPRTIEWSRQRIQTRLGVRTRAELVALARSL